MAAPLLDPLVSKIHQTTTTLSRATGILRSAFPGEHFADKGLAVQLPRSDVPTYILPNQNPQPWELMPMKAAAMAQYPNFFNYSCVFFGSLKRDVLNGLPFCLLRPTRLSIDLSKVVRNLGIVDGFELVQRRDRLRPYDFVWTPEQPEPEDMYDVALFPHRRIRLHLRTDMFSLRPHPGSQRGSGSPAQMPLSAQLAPAAGLLPFSTKNISKASQPVLMYPRQMEAARQRLPAGILICYHHELGLITDAVAELYDVPALVAAHVALPMSHVAQIRGALRLKAKAEAGTPLRHVTPLKVRATPPQLSEAPRTVEYHTSWNMVELIRQRVAERQAALAAATSPSTLPGVSEGEGWVGSSPAAARQELLEAARVQQEEARKQLSAALDAAIEMEDGLLAWQLIRSGTLGGPRGAAARPGGPAPPSSSQSAAAGEEPVAKGPAVLNRKATQPADEAQSRIEASALIIRPHIAHEYHLHGLLGVLLYCCSREGRGGPVTRRTQPYGTSFDLYEMYGANELFQPNSTRALDRAGRGLQHCG
ncbi:hypothetical protein VOLCADRAFT_104092 [Volvox carteri f. nagariensis]|uniref:Uncharacterized protein n=1 Tax=Volvox carteri f. nagariensis TaxID=3068 RepID=D8TR73_VOLCA|nr:uncharacterized protein VOLCADRAFT_104092 [Volvox carteri f. nagariensis]EFJ49842.1 hypothetical protein VOLCADRAFT_104092 [Volvox carteri f. nagariensis]|eukprot:XP_002948907.1 hypothetical protein VOLCADRAFT_104092 [Volvox carteri f. nagariensis]